MGVGHRYRHVVADYRDADLHDRLRDDGIHLPRHDRRTRLDRRKIQLPQARVGPRAQPPEVVRDLDRRHRHGSNRPARFNEGVLGCLGLKVVLGDPELRVRGRTDLLDDPPRELRVRIDPGSDGSPSNREFREGRPAGRHTSDTVVDLGLVPGELLDEEDRGRVRIMGTSRHYARVILLQLTYPDLYLIPSLYL